MLRDQDFELGNKLAEALEREIRLDAVFERLETELVQPARIGRECFLVDDVLERHPPPEGQSAPKQLGRPVGLAFDHGLSRAYEPLEAGRIELIGIDPERVAGRTRAQRRAQDLVRPRSLERRPQLRDVEPQLSAGR
jgi:hypothetical protein